MIPGDVTLNAAQVDALRRLIDHGKMTTSNRNRERCIAFATAEALAGRGLASMQLVGGYYTSRWEVRPTDAGREFIASFDRARS